MYVWNIFLQEKKKLVRWPSGQYGLAMPRTGCPSSHGFKWQSGYRYQSLIYQVLYDSKINYWSVDIKLKGPLTFDGLQHNFCMKDGDVEAPDWPAGRYCIYQYGEKCPSGFQSGSIQMIDRRNDSKNTVGGYVPSGKYDENTQFRFCCREDGDSHVAIELPTDRPFYLFRYGDECQSVKGMVKIEHFIRIAEDKRNRSKEYLRSLLETPHPKVDLKTFEGDVLLFYCYYDICK